MSIETAASIGLGLIKHHQEIGAALSKLSGPGFNKIMQELHLPQGLADKISNLTHQGQSAGISSTGSGTAQVLAGVKYFDANNDGQLSQDELTQGMDKLKTNGLDSTTNGAKLYSMGDMLLKNYAKVAQLDGNANGISASDATQLAGLDGSRTTLSSADWQHLNA